MTNIPDIPSTPNNATPPNTPNTPVTPSDNNSRIIVPNIPMPKLPGYAVLILTYIVTGLTLSDGSFSSPYKEIASAIIASIGTWLGIYPINATIKDHASLHYTKGFSEGVTFMDRLSKSDGSDN